LESLIGKKVFSTKTKDYYWEHVILTAIFSGEWSKLEDRTRIGIACSKRMDKIEEYPDQDDLNDRASEFRYERDLISAEEAEFWLSKRGISVDEWMSYILHSLLRDLWADQLEQIAGDYPVSREEVNDFISVEGICSNDLSRICHQLAGRVAVCEARKTLDTNENQALKEFDLDLSAFPFPIDAKHLMEVKRDLALIHVGFQEFYKQIVTRESLAAEIKIRGSDLIRFEVDFLELPSEQAAKEAVLCITEDRRSLEDVAEEAGLTLRKETLYSFQMDDTWKDAILGKQPGEFVGPFQNGETFLVSLIRNRTMPTVRDADVARLAEALMVGRIQDQEINNHIHWQS